MTGQGIVLEAEDQAEVEVRFAEFETGLNPRDGVDRFFVRRAAILTVRLDRCVRQEAAMTSERMRKAETDFDDARFAEVEQLLGAISDEPRANVRKLKQMPEGVERLIGAWEALRTDLLDPLPFRWSTTHDEKANNLVGRTLETFPASRITALSYAVLGNLERLQAHDGEGLGYEDRRLWAKQQLVALIDAELEKLRALRGTFDLEKIARDRAEARNRALFDPSNKAILARRYEANAERGLYQALGELKARAKLADATEPFDVKSETTKVCKELGSSFPIVEGPLPEDVPAEPEVEEPAPEPVEIVPKPARSTVQPVPGPKKRRPRLKPRR